MKQTRLCLGTVQFGMQYGIASAGRPQEQEAVRILHEALGRGVRTLDTAFCYGDAERVVGAFCKEVARADFCLVTKIKPDALDGMEPQAYVQTIAQEMARSLERLNVSYVDGCLFHNAAYVRDEAALAALATLKEQGLARKTGISVYTPEEFRAALESPYVDLIQLPGNLLDHRFDELLASPPAQSKELHVRSVFLQGLLLMEHAPERVREAQPYLDKIDAFCKAHKMSRLALCLQFWKARGNVDAIVFGVDNLTQFCEIADAFDQAVDTQAVLEFAQQFLNVPESIVNPTRWRNV